MSLPGFNLNNTYLNESSQFQQQLQQQQHQQPQQYLQHFHHEKSMFGIPLPPPLVMPPPPLFGRNMSPPRKRTRTSPEQLIILEKAFSTNPSPNNRVREQLSHQLGMPERSIQIWFQNRRAKVKNQAKRSIKVQDSTLYMQQQYAASAAAAACQSAAFQHQQDTIDPNLYYYYYYYYFHQQQQQQQQQSPISGPMDGNKNILSDGQIASLPMPPPPPPPPPAPSSSYSTPTSSWSSNHNNTSMTPPIAPELTLSASTSSSSITSDNHHIPRRRHHHRSSSASITSERTRAHSVGPYPYYRKSTPQERHSSMGPPPTIYTSLHTSIDTTPSNTQASSSSNNNENSDSDNNTPTSATSHQMLFGGAEPSSRLYTSTIIEEPYHITPSAKNPPQRKYGLTAQTLQIGSWKRVCDLNCHFDIAARRLIWCIGDDQQRFRMDINLNLVQFIRVHRSATSYRLEFFLSSPDRVGFFMTTSQNTWVQCHDFTQDRQASLENVHVLEDFSQLLETEFMEILMQAPDLQPLVIEEENGHHDLYQHQLCNSSQSLLLDDSADDSMASNLLLLQGLHLPQ